MLLTRPLGSEDQAPLCGRASNCELCRKAELDELNTFVAGRERTSLASNVEKLHHGTEGFPLGLVSTQEG